MPPIWSCNSNTERKASRMDEVYSRYAKRGKGRDSIRGRGRGHGRGRGRGQGRNFSGVNHPREKNNHQKWKEKDERPKTNGSETECYRCGGKGHWANIRRVPRYWVELYQASLKNKGPEANFVSDNDFDITHLDVADFFERLDGKIDHLI
uniref:CCHC-type domain-containing protein n=1 Tax=Nicotiana tabacum TaxID=4097 RepID=A0A1S4CXP8_TOBAC